MLKRALLAVAVVLVVCAADMAEARGRRCGSCCSGGGCAAGACEAPKAAATTDAEKAHVAKDQAPPAPKEEKVAEVKKSTDAAVASEGQSSRRRMGRHR
ncbi:MAG: hypothetical protein K8T91_22375 [Planctomycetes bacterium]|nr:hypothetical protein [Planctomycetota bacterium]